MPKKSDTRIVVQEYDLEKIGDEWETLVSTGIEIVKAHDRNRWTLGDLACKVERKYGEESIKSFALAVGVRPSTMYGYHATSSFFKDKDLRDRFQELTWSHYREAAKLDDRIPDEFETAMDLLEQAEDNKWNVEVLGDEVKRLIGNPITRKKAFASDAEIVSVKHADHGMVHVLLELPQDVDLNKLRVLQKQALTVKLFADPAFNVDKAAKELAHAAAQ